tara:strand:+ start:66 stop:230 length:165 start_codon:yes stop_codon:yes gene_type:complete
METIIGTKLFRHNQTKEIIRSKRKNRLAYKKKNRLIKALLDERNKLIAKLQECA